MNSSDTHAALVVMGRSNGAHSIPLRVTMVVFQPLGDKVNPRNATLDISPEVENEHYRQYPVCRAVVNSLLEGASSGDFYYWAKKKVELTEVVPRIKEFIKKHNIKLVWVDDWRVKPNLDNVFTLCKKSDDDSDSIPVRDFNGVDTLMSESGLDLHDKDYATGIDNVPHPVLEAITLAEKVQYVYQTLFA